MKYIAMILAFSAATAAAQEASAPEQQQVPAPAPEQAAFAREMIACGYKYVALKLIAPGNATPMEIAASGRTYLDAATQAAGEAFVERETPAIKQAGMDEATKIVTGGGSDTAKAIKKLKRDCDAKLAARPQS